MSILKNQVAIVTGASSGIGLGVAKALFERGMKVVLNGRNSERLNSLASEMDPSCCAVLAADASDPKTPEALLKLALDRFERCDVVFNGAGIMHAAKIEEIDLDLMSEMIRINVEGFTRMAYVALKHFKSAGNRGELINVSSILGTKVRPGTGVYAGSKYFVEAFSEAIRMEVAKTDIRVSVIEPGVVETGLQSHFPVHPKEVLGIEHPLMPEDIARCVLFLLDQPKHVRIPIMMALPGEQAM